MTYFADYYKKHKTRLSASAQQWRQKNRDRYNATLRAWNKANPEKRRAYMIKARWGLSLEEYNSLVKKQEGRCAICQSVLDNAGRTHVDHHHETKQIRGLLCQWCNIGLGHFKDNPELLTAAKLYVEKFQ